MRGETQAVHLAKIMQKHKLYPEYELVLPLVRIKKNSLKKLSKGNILLLGLESLDMLLLSKEKICANVVIDGVHNSTKIKITSLEDKAILPTNSKKYETLKCSFGILQSRKLEVGHKIDIASLNSEEILLIVEGRTIAKGALVNVDEEIAIQIDKVMI
ncbi:FliM/FliN family flagellar motor switch protein [Sulfurovum sp.]|uniref:FliM/FliN family flagellar motor switch protein n=1 Tax=Sulfurovum sp. TaxID=1969726 RepID=UPI0025DF728B|nr:FliM/FliN family flagellar motor switch protein [Sulfurovum sp.]